eukprot:166847-Prymnesium_polylepis.1
MSASGTVGEGGRKAHDDRSVRSTHPAASVVNGVRASPPSVEASAVLNASRSKLATLPATVRLKLTSCERVPPAWTVSMRCSRSSRFCPPTISPPVIVRFCTAVSSWSSSNGGAAQPAAWLTFSGLGTSATIAPSLFSATPGVESVERNSHAHLDSSLPRQESTSSN